PKNQSFEDEPPEVELKKLPPHLEKLNEATRKDHFPLPFMDQMLERLAGNEYYCFLDGFSGYFQIPIDPKDQEKPRLRVLMEPLPTNACRLASAMHLEPSSDGAFSNMYRDESNKGSQSHNVSKTSNFAFVARPNNKNNNWISNNNQPRKLNRPNVVCTNCNMNSHTVDRSFELVGYPHNFKKNNNNGFNKGNTSSNAILGSKDQSTSNSFTDDQCKKLMALISEKSSFSNMPANIEVFGNSFSTCLTNLKNMLKRCEDTKLTLNWEKSHFMVKEGIVLGHKISKKGIEVDKVKIEVISKLPHPTIVKGIRSFLGHVGFYRRFIKDFSKISRPMTHLLEKNSPFIFSNECIQAFRTLKDKLTEASILIAPNWDQPFELMCDASDYAVGAVLGQRIKKHF
nr:reverse transcriptase domain-containing protein [Tanacetum cinerariifolium]